MRRWCVRRSDLDGTVRSANENWKTTETAIQARLGMLQTTGEDINAAFQQLEQRIQDGDTALFDQILDGLADDIEATTDDAVEDAKQQLKEAITAEDIRVSIRAAIQDQLEQPTEERLVATRIKTWQHRCTRTTTALSLWLMRANLQNVQGTLTFATLPY